MKIDVTDIASCPKAALAPKRISASSVFDRTYKGDFLKNNTTLLKSVCHFEQSIMADRFPSLEDFDSGSKPTILRSTLLDAY